MDKNIKEKLIDMLSYPKVTVKMIQELAEALGEKITESESLCVFDSIKTKRIENLRHSVKFDLDRLYNKRQINDDKVYQIVETINSLISFFRLGVEDLLIHSIIKDDYKVREIKFLSRAWNSIDIRDHESAPIMITLNKEDNWKFTVNVIEWEDDDIEDINITLLSAEAADSLNRACDLCQNIIIK